MWLVFGNKTKARRVDGGREARRHCPDCGAVRTFLECDVTDKLEIFFVEVADATTRRMVCAECGEDFDVDEFFGRSPDERRGVSMPAAPRPDSTIARPDRARLQAGTGEKRKVSETDKEEMLRALKRKMGKPEG